MGTLIRRNEVLTEIHVEELVYPDQQATEAEVCYSPADIVQLAAHVLPKVVLGSLHSHPNCEPHISKQDLVSSQRYAETVFGIYSFWPCGAKRCSSLDWYFGAKRLTGI